MWHTQEWQDAVQKLETDGRQGLSEAEAARRLASFGPNTIDSGERPPSFLKKLLAQLGDFMVLLLLAAAGLSFAVSYARGEADYVDSIVILAIVVVNALLGVVQESKAEQAIAALRAMAAPHARVWRGGVLREIPAEEVVPGDILELEAGDYVPADARLLETASLRAAEAALTGEAEPVEKEAGCVLPAAAPVGDRKNMVFSATYIVYGRGRAVVTATGMDTEMGRIAGLMTREKQEETPLQKRLGQTGRVLGAGALAICGGIFLLGLWRQIPPFTMFMTAVSLAVAAIPEGLTAIVTIVLALGMQRLSKQNAIVRRLTAVEALGGAQVICSDKTGTLTQNRMQVTAWADETTRTLTDPEKCRVLWMLAALCSDVRTEGEVWAGEPTELALAEGARAAGQDKTRLEAEFPRVGELPFSSERKRMTTLHRVAGRGFLQVMKGAPEVVLARCSHTLTAEGKATLTAAGREQALAQCGGLAAEALRVLALAYRESPQKPGAAQWENGLVFVGFLGLWDPPRPEAAEAVALCQKAGIRPVMVTGDHGQTARAVAARLGIFREGDRVVEGPELEEMTEEALKAACGRATVFARVSPTHKLRIVRAFQARGLTVAMTGDGVNDAPALRAADIGCAMGKNGTEVAKAAADIILADDNFSTIVAAVREGRGIFSNIQKAVHFLLSCNIGEILSLFLAMLLGWAAPLLPIQLLWVNLVTDSLPAIALGLEPTPDSVMEQPPRPRQAGIFSGGLGSRIGVEGAMIGALTLLAFCLGRRSGGELVGRTMAFAVLSLSQLVHAFNMRSEDSVFRLRPGSNPFLWLALGVGLCLQTAVVQGPKLRQVFGTVALTAGQWGFVALLSLLPLGLVELEKFLSRKS